MSSCKGSLLSYITQISTHDTFHVVIVLPLSCEKGRCHLPWPPNKTRVAGQRFNTSDTYEVITSSNHMSAFSDMLELPHYMPKCLVRPCYLRSNIKLIGSIHPSPCGFAWFATLSSFGRGFNRINKTNPAVKDVF